MTGRPTAIEWALIAVILIGTTANAARIVANELAAKPAEATERKAR